MICPDKNHPQYKLMVNALTYSGHTLANAEALAHLLWKRNGNNFMDKAPNGKPSKVYNNVKLYDGGIYAPVLTKMKTLTKGFQNDYDGQVDANGEPNIERGRIVGKNRSYRLVPPDITAIRNYNIQQNKKGVKGVESKEAFLERVEPLLNEGRVIPFNKVKNLQKIVEEYNDARRSVGMGPAFRVWRNESTWVLEEHEGDPFFSFDDPTWLNNAFGNMSDYISGYIHQLRMNLIKDPARKAYYEAEIKRMEEASRQIEKTYDYDGVADMANSEMDKIVNVLNGDPSVHELHNALISVSTWKKLPEVLIPSEETESTLGNQMVEVASRARSLEQRLNGKIKNYLLNLSRKELDQKIQMSDFEKLVETSVANAEFRDLSTNPNKVVQMIGKILADQIRQGQAEHYDYLKKLDKQILNLKKSPLWKKEKFDPILQFNKKGGWTGGHINTYSYEWFEKLKELRDNAIEATSTKGRKVAWGKYWDFKNNNEFILDTNVLFGEKDGEIVIKDDAAAKELKRELIRQAGEDHAKHVLQLAEERYRQYIRDKAAFTEQALVDQDVNDPAATDRKINEWIAANSPDNYIRRRQKKLFKGQDNKSTAWRYFVSVPKSEVNGEATGWYDERFKQLVENPEYKEYKQFYNFMRESMSDFLSKVPEHYVANLNANFLPELGQSFYEKIGSKGMAQTIKNIPIDEWNSLFENSLAVMTNAINPLTNKPYQNLPIGFLRTGTPVEDRTKDVAVMLQMFSGMAINYEKMNEIEDTISLLQEIVNEADEVKNTSQGGFIVNTANRMVPFGKNTSMTSNAVNYAIDAIMYNKRRSSEGKIFVSSDLSKEEQDRVKELADELKKNKEALESGEIDYEEYNYQLARISRELQEIRGKDFVTSRVFDKVLQITQIKGMAFNPFAASANLGFGLMSNFVHAAGEEDFTTSQLLRAITMMMSNILKSWTRGKLGGQTGKKISNIMGSYNVLFEVNEAKYGKQKYTEKTRRGSPNAYFMQTMTEFVVQGVTTIAIMLNTEVTGKDGKTYNLWEVHNEDATINKNLVDEETADRLHRGDLFRKNQNRIIQVNKLIHGNYDISASPMKIKKTALGRGAMQFRTWIPEGVANRIQNDRYDEMLGRQVKGRWRSYGMLFRKNGILGTPKSLLEMLKGIMKVITLGRAFPKAFEGLSEVDKANMQRNMMELSFAAIFILISTMLGSDDDEDELSTARRMLNVFMNLSNRIESDIYFYINPGTFEEITRNPLPVFKTITDTYEATDAAVRLPFDENVDSEYFMRKAAKALPFVNLIPKWYGYSGRVY